MVRGRKPKRENIDWSASVAYAVGVIATDGCLSNDGRHILLVSKDIEQLENIKICLTIDAQIKKHSIGNTSWAVSNEIYYRLQWGDVTLYRFLVSIGLTPKKSLTIGQLAIPDEYFFDFLRGSLDGDGSFYSYYDSRWKNSFMYYLTFISASSKHIEWLQDSVNRLIGMNGHVTTSGRKCRMTNLRYAKSDTDKILALLYASPDAVCLSRKRLKIAAALGIVGKSLPT